ncbi:hypothetical protein SB49_02405 [Sediminicola sp. YIK13]|uniref:glycosyltransferase n=1 Tax=Sediminicola sp. YIK13 TaxID=1453352 RepID=UPI00072015F8|nr:glycosyltransferase [Sediminicola sp. YIK13]ALM06782.1 hypothetical protein SB49_02405 [Sediminicola sp. YIK13]
MNNKKNIAFLLTRISERGGISRVVSIITNVLQKTELYNIHIISYIKKEEYGYKWNNKIIYHDLLDESIPMKKGLPKAAFGLRKIINKNNIEILISCGQLVGPLGVISTLFKKTKHVYWSHSSFKAKTGNKFKEVNEQFTAIFANAIVSLTKTDLKNYKHGTFASNIKQIYNPIDPRAVNSHLPYKLNAKKIISVGRLTDQKNFELLVDVAKIVLEKHKDYVWHIYGSGENEHKIQKKIEQNGLIDKLVLKGQSNDLYSIYNQYSFMVMTSKYEGFPMSLIEGLANNLPLISFDIPTGPSEIIRNNINGFLIRPFRIIEMANKIDELIINEDKRISFSNNNKEFINDFNIHSITTKWINLFNSLKN